MHGINTTKFWIGKSADVLRIFSSNIQITKDIVSFVFTCDVSAFITTVQQPVDMSM